MYKHARPLDDNTADRDGHIVFIGETTATCELSDKSPVELKIISAGPGIRFGRHSKLRLVCPMVSHRALMRRSLNADGTKPFITLFGGKVSVGAHGTAHFSLAGGNAGPCALLGIGIGYGADLSGVVIQLSNTDSF